jgi:glycosyltransferase involved in cell wall biosynthesis
MRKKMAHNPNVFFQEHALLSYTGNLATSLSEIGVNVNLFTMQPKRKKLEEQGVNVKHFPLSKLFWVMPKGRNRKIVERYTLRPWLLKTVKNGGSEVLHVNFASKSEIFLKAKDEYKLPLVYTNHYVPEPEPLDKLVDDFAFNEEEKFWIPPVCEQASEVVTVSKYAQRRLKEEFGIDSSCVYHGVDLNKYNPSLPKERKTLGLDPDEKIVLWVARFGHHPYKDPFTFIKAIPLVLKQHPKTRFVMIGNGFLKPLIVELANKLSVSKNVKIIEFVSHLNLFYAASDVFVLPTFNDNFGLVVAEAMACGKPVIVSDKGAPPEIVGDAGLVFQYGSPADLAEKLVFLLDDEESRQKIGAKAHRRIVENFTWDKAARKYLEIYKRVL